MKRIHEGDNVRVTKEGRYWHRPGRVTEKRSDPHEKTVYIVSIMHRVHSYAPTLRPVAFWREEIELLRG